MFVNRTKNDLETNALVGKRISRKYKILFGGVMAPIFIVLGIACLMVEIFVAEEKDWFLSIFMLVMGVFFLAYVLFFDKLVGKLNKKYADGKEAEVTYTFTEDGYEFTAVTNDGSTSVVQGGYSAFTKCDEYEDMWLLYYNKVNMYALKKDGMQEGTAEEFTEFLKGKTGERYKVKYKKKQ